MRDDSPVRVSEFSSERVFSLFDYYISHQHMLLRSSAGSGGGENLDLIFGAVQYVELPSTLHGVRITRPSREEAAGVEARSGADTNGGALVYALDSGGRRFYVVASTLRIHKNTLPSLKSSLVPMCSTDKAAYDEHYSEYVTEYLTLAR